MVRYNFVDRRALVTATALIALGTVVRIALAPSAADLDWQPAAEIRPAESLSQARSRVDSALSSEAAAALPLAPGEKIEINTAGAIALRRLPGVGKSRAAAIVEDRLVHGPYGAIEDLVRVPGIGEGLVNSLSAYMKVIYVGKVPVDNPVGSRLDLNRAQTKELEQITGIGPALAARIAALRAARGRFQSLDELIEIPGIGPKTLEILRDEAYVR